MKGKERVLCALRRGRPDCVPVLPQIWLDHAARISGVDPLEIMRKPHLGFRAMLQTARHYGLDGFRTFLIYDSRHVVREGERTRAYLVIYGHLDHVAKGLAASAKLEPGAALGVASPAPPAEISLEARQVRESAAAKAGPIDDKRLTDPALAIPIDLRDVLPLR